MTTSAAKAYDPTRRNVLLLALCQALGMTGMSMLMIIVSLLTRPPENAEAFHAAMLKDAR